MESTILGNQLVVLSRADLDALVREAASKTATVSENNIADERPNIINEEALSHSYECPRYFDKTTLIPLT